VILNHSEKKRLQQTNKVHAEAHQLYLQGRYKVEKLNYPEISEAINIFSTALQKPLTIHRLLPALVSVIFFWDI
jgi:hypothetical protein